MKDIETTYGGYRMRSRLEARWAVFFDRLGVRWIYEPEGYGLPNGQAFLPDFLLTNVGLREGKHYSQQDWSKVFIEVKPTRETADRYAETYKFFGMCAPHPLIVCISGQPFGGHPFNLAEASDDIVIEQWANPIAWDAPMFLCRCYRCHAMKFEFIEHDRMQCPFCGSQCDDGHPAIDTAIEAARAARFE